MIVPPPLKYGSKIGIVSTASKIDREIIYKAADRLKKDGYQVEIGDSTFSNHHQFAGTDNERAVDLQRMIDNPEIDAIICSRGGYGTLRTIQSIDWTNFLKSPKWIVGFSDVTVLHAKLNQLGVASIHGVMPRYFLENDNPTESYQYLKDALSSKSLTYKIPSTKFNRCGKVSGELIGGNLSILYSLRGTPLDIYTCGKILFIEDLAEYLYHLDRMMMNLKIGGKLKNLAGLLVGSFSGMKDNETPFGKSVEEIILDVVSEYNFPVAFDFPAGHKNDNFALQMGCMASLSVEKETTYLNQ